MFFHTTQTSLRQRLLAKRTQERRLETRNPKNEWISKGDGRLENGLEEIVDFPALRCIGFLCFFIIFFGSAAG